MHAWMQQYQYQIRTETFHTLQGDTRMSKLLGMRIGYVTCKYLVHRQLLSMNLNIVFASEQQCRKYHRTISKIFREKNRLDSPFFSQLSFHSSLRKICHIHTITSTGKEYRHVGLSYHQSKTCISTVQYTPSSPSPSPSPITISPFPLKDTDIHMYQLFSIASIASLHFTSITLTLTPSSQVPKSPSSRAHPYTHNSNFPTLYTLHSTFYTHPQLPNYHIPIPHDPMYSQVFSIHSQPEYKPLMFN